jgi:hypothetical protein
VGNVGNGGYEPFNLDAHDFDGEQGRVLDQGLLVRLLIKGCKWAFSGWSGGSWQHGQIIAV